MPPPVNTRKSIVTADGLEIALEAPRVPGAFLYGKGTLGIVCDCGWVVSARSMDGIEQGLRDHQVGAHCASMAAYEAEYVEQP